MAAGEQGRIQLIKTHHDGLDYIVTVLLAVQYRVSYTEHKAEIILVQKIKSG